MAKTENSRRFAAAPSPADRAPAPVPADLPSPETPESLDKVRDILFGHQMREVDRRFARLEERILKETRDLKDDLKRRLDALEAYTNKEADELATKRADYEDAFDKAYNVFATCVNNPPDDGTGSPDGSDTSTSTATSTEP